MNETDEIKRDLLIEVMMNKDFLVGIDMTDEKYSVFLEMYRKEHLIKWRIEEVNENNLGVVPYGRTGWTITDKGRAWLERHR